MSDTAVEALGPEPFRFTPQAGPSIEGPAFSRTFKLLATAIVFGMGGWMGVLWLSGKATGGAVSIFSWFLAALAMLACFWWWILRSRTRIDADGLHQSWVWQKHMAMRELAHVRLVRVRGLEWLVAPRLYARTLAGKLIVFYAADPALLREFERLAGELAAFHRR
ncbi:hypothetical protein GCM10027034_12450 [Ramlibacter solisilvae]|uniref:Uncharacterized protein n=1 Tax=Ramlibacter tataouinensis TaxID=94132 RepID=A0A127JX42_9BURK|nr:hypothetical protein [Ramlibacter tataouinensis]AMO24481.1 hypothetical protein UC35_18610 [Ramlibacter tataouinensis]